MPLYKGYVETKGKASIEKLKNRTKWKTYDEVKNLNGFGGVLSDDTILIDIDDSDQSEILMNIVEELQLDCKVDRKSTRLNSSHGYISYAVFCLKKRKNKRYD